MHVNTKWGKHTLKEDRHKRTERYRIWTKCNDDPRQVLGTLSASDISTSGAWLPTQEHDYRTKLFDDPRNPDSSKENMLPLESAPMAIFNVEERNVLDKTEKLVGTDNNWEGHVAKQIPLLRTSSTSPNTNDKQPGLPQQLEIFSEDNMDIRDFFKRPQIDMRPQKPTRKTKTYILDLIHPSGCPDYMVMNQVVMDIPKPPQPEIRSLLMEKRKVPIGWPACLKRSPQRQHLAIMTSMQRTLVVAKTSMKSHKKIGQQKKNKNPRKEYEGFLQIKH